MRIFHKPKKKIVHAHGKVKIVAGMRFEDYRKALADEDFAPGWEVIEDSFAKCYPNQKPKHYATTLTSRALFGGNEYLDGYSIYTSPKGYQHIVTYGMTNLYGDEQAFGQTYSRWGYEMTMKLQEHSSEDCVWACNMLGNLARYTYTTKRFFEENQYVLGNQEPIKRGSDSKITSLLIIKDNEIPEVESVHGLVTYLQLVGILWEEACAIREDPSKIPILLENMRKDNPNGVTDLERVNAYL